MREKVKFQINNEFDQLTHVLIYKNGLLSIPPVVADRYIEIPVDRLEAEALATNVLSIAPDTIIARSSPDCARVNGILRRRAIGSSRLHLTWCRVPAGPCAVPHCLYAE